jgi:putative peptidoglycan lipid II flippase
MARGGVGSATALIAVLAAVSAVLGLGRDIVAAAVFGAGPDLDAYFVAQGLMNLVLGLIAGAMAKASVPVLARQAGGRDGRAGHTLMVTLSVTLVVLGLASAALTVLAGPVVAVLAPGFGPAQAATAQTLTKIVLLATVLIAGTNLLAAAAQAHRRFFWAAFQGVPFNLVMIVAVAVFGPRYGVTALAVGFVAGSLVRLLCQIVPLRPLGLRLRPSLDLRDPGFREIAVLVPPLLLGSAVGNVNTLVDRAVGSAAGDGAITALSYGWRLVALGEVLLVASLVTALYPVLGTAAGNLAELHRLVGRGLTATAVVLTPVMIVLLVAAGPIVRLLFQRGSFDAADAAMTTTALIWYAPALVALGWREVVVRASFAVGDSRAPVAVAVLAMAVNVTGDLTLGVRYGVPGLAASTSLSLVAAAVANTWLLRLRHDAVTLRPLVGILAGVAAAGTVATAAGLGARRLSPGGDVVTILVTGAVVCVVFSGLQLALRGPAAEVLRDAARLLRR